MTRLIDADKLLEDLKKTDRYFMLKFDIENAPTVSPQKVVTIPHELIEKLVLCVVDTVENIDWDKALEVYKERPTCKWLPVSDVLPEIGKEVIVTDIETSDTYTSEYLGNGFWECDNGTFKNRVIAWQPLPEPYKEGGDY